MTNAQANAVLDLYDECWRVRAAKEQLDAHARFQTAYDEKPSFQRAGDFNLKKSEVKKMATDTQRDYDEAVERLTYLYCQAEEFQVSCELLDNLVALLLPNCDLTKALAV